MTAGAVFLHCGLRIRSEIGLFLPRASDEDTYSFEVDVRWGPDLDDSAAYPSGVPVAEFEENGRRLYTATRQDHSYVVRFPECGEFVIAEHLDRVSVRRDPGGEHVDLLPVLMSGTVAAIVHGLRGATLLHASAVEVDGRALAFIGRSGQGKSTIAGLLCAHGASLVTDDVLLVDQNDPAMCVGGANEVRLRSAAADLADAHPEFTSRVTPDARTAIAPANTVEGSLPLGAIVIPSPSREADEVTLVELPPKPRLLALLAFPRIAGWTDRAVLARQFATLARLAERVPVYTATVPWGPPFDPEVARALMQVGRAVAPRPTSRH